MAQVPRQNIPDDWLREVRFAGGYLRTCCGKETGFTHFTPTGFEAMKGELRKAFEGAGANANASACRGSWDDFEKHAAAEFEQIRKTTTARIVLLRKQANELEASL